MLLNEEQGHWAAQYGFDLEPGRPALFLDRDGVIVEEVHFLSKIEDIRLVRGMAEAIAEVNRLGMPVIVVTNQSGVGRGLFSWDAFVAVNAEINVALSSFGAHVDAVFACGGSGLDPQPDANVLVDWRKPGAGMLLAGRDLFQPDMKRSGIIGDRVSDIEAGYHAGVAWGWMVMTGYGTGHRDKFHARFPAPEPIFDAGLAATPPEAVMAFLNRVKRSGG